MYEPNIKAPNYSKQILTYLKGEIDNTVIIGNFNIPLSTMYRSPRKKINKESGLELYPKCN